MCDRKESIFLNFKRKKEFYETWFTELTTEHESTLYLVGSIILLSIKGRKKVQQSRNACQLVPLLRDQSKMLVCEGGITIENFQKRIETLFFKVMLYKFYQSARRA